MGGIGGVGLKLGGGARGCVRGRRNIPGLTRSATIIKKCTATSSRRVHNILTDISQCNFSEYECKTSCTDDMSLRCFETSSARPILRIVGSPSPECSDAAVITPDGRSLQTLSKITVFTIVAL